MGKKHTFLLCLCPILVASPALANTPTPSPSPSLVTISLCAPIATGIPQKVLESKCPEGTRTLGRGPVIHGTARPKGLHPHLRNRFLSAQSAAQNLGFKISVHSGWRSWQTQARLYQNALTKYKSARVASRWVLPPEKSMHVWGVALDVQFGSAAAQNWFRWNSNHFGLCRTYKNEWWHYEPVISPGGKCPPMQPFAR
ncbi:MAG: D-alanyl-D-alanine carboxypeptidase family protein [Actinobacteria bacterium]|nr:D-alanyl-D-alanine carboxypeptidase family protein [Actinomycetota bacterium]